MLRKSLFISHISDEKELAEILKENLEKHFLGLLDIFVSSDRETIHAGSKWLESVDNALKSADLLIVLCSKESVNRPWVNFEAGAAWIRDIGVIPVCHSGLQPTDLPVPLSMLQSIVGHEVPGLHKLYDAIASSLEVNVPTPDFEVMAGEIKEIEQKYTRQTRGIEVIHNPRILCAATEQYMEPSLGFHLDVAVLTKHFPGCVEVVENLTRMQLVELLTSQRFDIVHLVMGIDYSNGDLVFSQIATETDNTTTTPTEVMSAEGFASLLLESKTKLVVLATCEALLLAVEVAKFANMAASDAQISGEQAEKWEDCFYSLLASGKDLFKAFDITKTQLRDIPIRAIRYKNIAFSVAVDRF